MSEKLRVLMVADAACIRLIKQAIVLLDAGHEVCVLCRRVANAEMEWLLPLVSKYAGQQDLQVRAAQLAGGDKVDVVHVHNEPSDIVSFMRTALPRTPIVMDCHDLEGMRTGEATALEARALADADAAQVPSQGYAAGVRRLYGEAVAGKCVQVVYSWQPAAMQVPPQQFRQWLPALVYEGGTVGGAHRLQYRDWRDVARLLRQRRIPFGMYCSSAAAVLPLAESGAMAFPPYLYDVLLDALSGWAWGLVGPSYVPCQAFDGAMPNKLQEYLAAGVPAICWGAQEAGEWILEHEVGVVLDGPDDLTPQRWEQLLKLRERLAANVLEQRHWWTMERQLPLILETYEAARRHALEERG